MRLPALLKSARIVYPLALVIRLLFIFVGAWQDRNLSVKYTDIDYEVVTDAAKLVVNGDSPYGRATYRYSPLLAYILVPNVLLHPCWGKIVFSIGDLAVGRCVESILIGQGIDGARSLQFACLWLLNPLSINVSTRGSFDSITSALVLWTTFSVLKGSVVLAAIVYGVAVHLRVYPIIYALTFALATATDPRGMGTSTQNKPGVGTDVSLMRLFNRRTLVFAFLSASTFFFCTFLCVWTYGQEYTQNALLYHVTRTDNRHNYSMYWYWIYLDYGATHRWLLGLVSFVPQAVLMFAVAVRFFVDLPFCILVQTVVFVVFNKVCTGQYFTWYLSLVPVVLPKLAFRVGQAWSLVGMWACALAGWLFYAWHLEMQGNNTFLYLWGASILFFMANVILLACLVGGYKGVEMVEKK
ncbi:unnamed protein product [Discosporangium mesarthrocarpum]